MEYKKYPVWKTGNVLLGTQRMSCLEHKECSAPNTRNDLLQTRGTFCFEHKECPSSNTRNVLLRTQRMSFFEHKECPSSNIRNVLLRTQRMSFFIVLVSAGRGSLTYLSYLGTPSFGYPFWSSPTAALRRRSRRRRGDATVPRQCGGAAMPKRNRQKWFEI